MNWCKFVWLPHMFSVPKFVRPVCVFSAPGELHFFVAAIMLHFRRIPIVYEEGLIDQGVATKRHLSYMPLGVVHNYRHL